MDRRKPIKTTIREAVDYWSRRVSECDLSVDWSEAETHCWRCGCEKDLQRCHIVPDALGGKDEPSNLVLLCSRCHAEGPNVTDPEVMWDWIRAYSVPFYETFWSIMGRKEYQFIYHKKVRQELADLMGRAGIPLDEEKMIALLEVEMRKAIENTSVHFGQPYLNSATIAGMYRMILKNLADDLGVPLAAERDPEEDLTGNPGENRESPWWMV